MSIDDERILIYSISTDHFLSCNRIRNISTYTKQARKQIHQVVETSISFYIYMKYIWSVDAAQFGNLGNHGKLVYQIMMFGILAMICFSYTWGPRVSWCLLDRAWWQVFFLSDAMGGRIPERGGRGSWMIIVRALMSCSKQHLTGHHVVNRR